MDPILRRQFVHRLFTTDGSEGHPGFELTAVLPSLLTHGASLVPLVVLAYSVVQFSGYIIPIRCVPAEKITTHERLLLAFDALVLSQHFGKLPPFGKIIHGNKPIASKVTLSASLLAAVQAILGKIAVWQTISATPELVLNPHCSECEFRTRCRQIAMEKDDLSLLSRMTAQERTKQHNKGIFTLTQFSYTFRLRKQRKRDIDLHYRTDF